MSHISGNHPRAQIRGAVTTLDRVRHILAAQLEADFCLPAGAISQAQNLGAEVLSALQLPTEEMSASRRRNVDTWELRVGNYLGVGLLCAKYPRVLKTATEYMRGDLSNWLGDYAPLRQLNELLTPYSQQVSGTSVYYTPSRNLLESVVPPDVPAQEVKCEVPGIGMMHRVDSGVLRESLRQHICGLRTVTKVPNASADEGDTAFSEFSVRIEFLQPEQYERFRGDPRYSNALGFSKRRPDITVLAAFDPDAATALADPLAMAGASDDSPLMRQIGIDVLPQVRQRGLAARLVYELSRMVLADGRVPFYGTSPSHVLSQRVALAAGFIPTWWEFVSTSMHDMPLDEAS